VCNPVRHPRTHPGLFGGRMNGKLSVNFLGRWGCCRLRHWSLLLQSTLWTFSAREQRPMVRASEGWRANKLSANDAWWELDRQKGCGSPLVGKSTACTVGVTVAKHWRRVTLAFVTISSRTGQALSRDNRALPRASTHRNPLTRTLLHRLV